MGTRDLTRLEREGILKQFKRLNGIADRDVWTKYMGCLPEDIHIWQIRGYVSFLRLKVAKGELVLKNMRKYNEWLKTRPDIGSQYNSPKYKAIQLKQKGSRDIRLHEKLAVRILSMFKEARDITKLFPNVAPWQIIAYAASLKR